MNDCKDGRSGKLKNTHIVTWPDAYFIITPNSETLFHPYRAKSSAALCLVDS